MFGTNEIRKRSSYNNSNEKIQVQDIFYTIQGEGPFAGRPAVFIRLTGCNQRCWFCDTKWDDDNDPWLTPSEIVEKVNELFTNHTYGLVVITGGEPLLQDLTELLYQLRYFNKRTIQIETAGTVWQKYLVEDENGIFGEDIHVVISPKTPTVLEHFHKNFGEYKRTDINVYWKYVIKKGNTDENTGLPFWNTQTKNGKNRLLAQPKVANLSSVYNSKRIYLSPCDEYDEKKNLENTQEVARLSMKYGYNAGIQLHKYFNIA